MLQAQLGEVRVLTRRGERRLWMLDANSALLWDMRATQTDFGAIAGHIARRFGLEFDIARRYLDELQDGWRSAGLLDEPAPSADPDRERETLSDDVFETLAASIPQSIANPVAGALRLVLAQRAILFHPGDDPKLRALLERYLAPVCVPDFRSDSAAPTDQLILSGDEAQWRLTLNGVEIDAGVGRDAALVATLSALTELGCRARERLLVAHGAGLVSPDGRGLLLIAPGGSGKSTLAMALEAEGFRLLSDDVVPIRPDGAALGLGLPACLKKGSWPVLANYRPDLSQEPEITRFGQTVRFLPPGSAPAATAVAPALFIFPKYRPGVPPDCAPLAPEQALQRIIGAEAVIRDLTQEKLEALCRWVMAAPACALDYPTLAEGVSLVGGLLGETAMPACARNEVPN